MKKIILVNRMVIRTFVVVLGILTSASCFSQSCKYNEYINYLRNEGYTISKELKSSLSQSQTSYFWKTFSRLRYIIVAASDDGDVSDVDVYLYDNDGTTLLVKDTDTSSLAAVTITPNYERSMKIVVKNYRSATPNFSSTVRYIVAYK